MKKKALEFLPNLLIVDDDPHFLLTLEKIILNKTSANPIKAKSGFEALEKTKDLELALAIIDIGMPNMDGYELGIKLNEERSKEKVPIIFLTGKYLDEDQISKGYASGIVDYILKPVNAHVISSKINVFLDLYNQKQMILKNTLKLKKAHDKLTKINNALKKSEEKYRTLLNASPDGIFITDLKGMITDLSEISLELLGTVNKNNVVGKNIYRFISEDEKHRIREIFEKTMHEGLFQNIEVKIKKKDQSLFLGEISVTLIQDPEGEPFSYMIIVRDISQRKKIEKKQIHADRMASLGEMAAGIAHEINQPLNTISLIMDNILYETTLKENVEKAYLLEKSDKIFKNIERIKNIIYHVRVFSRSDEDNILTRFDINVSIKNAISMMSEQMKHRAISLKLSLAKGLPAINGNTYRFEQVILNILLNAKDAILEKKNNQSVPFDMVIEIKSYQKDEELTVEISDNGIGIKEEDLEYIMLPFYTTKDTGKGTGLGLYISYQIINEMNGLIEIDSNLSQGTTFKIILKN